MTIFISAGHTNDSDGANFKEEFFEHSEAVIWRNIICELLRLDPVPIGTLTQKISYINKNVSGPSVAVEIHFNSAIKNKKHIGKGSETLHYPGSKSGMALAAKIHNEILKSFSPDRGLKEGYYQQNSKKPVLAFLAKTKCPAIIIEPEFIHRHELIVSNRGTCCRDIARALSC